jgi:hypothetical protein
MVIYVSVLFDHAKKKMNRLSTLYKTGGVHDYNCLLS